MTILFIAYRMLILLQWLSSSSVNSFLFGRHATVLCQRRKQIDQFSRNYNNGDAISLYHRLTTTTKTTIQQQTTAGSSSSDISLQFVANTSFTSHPVPTPSSSSSDDSLLLLIKFFQNPNHRNHLLLGNKEPPAAVEPIINNKNSTRIMVSPTSSKLMLWDRWKEECVRMGTVPPSSDPLQDDNDDEIMVLVKSNKIVFPLGLELYIESIVGIKLILPDHQPSPPSPPSTVSSNPNKRKYPEYQFTLIQDHVIAKGPKPLVWLHNQIMKSQKKKQEEFSSSNNNSQQKQQQMTHSCSILQMKEISTTTTTTTNTDNEEDDNALVVVDNKAVVVVFTYDATIEINVIVPKLLIKLLPMSREKCNEQGSAAIQKAFQIMGRPSLDNFVTSYELWMSSSSGENLLES